MKHSPTFGHSEIVLQLQHVYEVSNFELIIIFSGNMYYTYGSTRGRDMLPYFHCPVESLQLDPILILVYDSSDLRLIMMVLMRAQKPQPPNFWETIF